MFLTEKEAKTKWCHRTFPTGAGDRNNGPFCCEASECMAWRWLPKNENTPMNHKAEWVLSGYCGLATRPEEA